MFINDWDGGPIVNSAGLTTFAGANQHARVDLLTSSAPETSTAATDVIHNFYLGSDPVGVTGIPHAYQTYTFDITPFVAPGQRYQLRFAEVNTQGNMNLGVDNVSIDATMDTTPPATTASLSGTAGGGEWYRSAVSVSLSATDKASGVAATYYQVNGGAQLLYTGPFSVSTEGTNSINYWSVDRVGNVEATKSLAISIDKTPPTIGGTLNPSSPATTGWYNSSTGAPTYSYTASDAGSGLDGASPSSGSYPFGEGSGLVHTFTVTDLAGNSVSATSPSVQVDLTAPSTSVASIAGPVASNDWYTGAVTVTLLPADDRSGVDQTFYSIDGGAPQAGTSLALSDDGVHTIRYWSVDLAGNVEAAKMLVVAIDQTRPTADLSSGPGSPTNSTSATFAFRGDDATSGVVSFQTSLDGGDFETATSPQTFTGLADGPHTFAFRAVDAAGNVSDTVPIHWTIDTVPPDTAITSRPPSATNSTSADFIFGADDPAPSSGVSTFIYSLDGGPWTGSGGKKSGSKDPVKKRGDPGSLSLTDLAEGPHTLQVAAVDDAGNNDPTPASYTWLVDLTPPTLIGEPTAPPNANAWYNGDVVIHWTATDFGAGIDPATIPADSLITGEGANLGASATVLDLAGNIASNDLEGVKIDRTAPTTTASSLPSDWVNHAVTVSFSAADGLSGVAATYYTIDGGSVQTYTGAFDISTDGDHILQYWSVDRADNVESAQALHIRLDLTPPTIAGSRTPAANAFGWNNTDVMASYNAGDSGSGLDSPDAGSFVFDAEGTAQSHTFTVLDRAGNVAIATIIGVNIDKTRPAATILSGPPSVTSSTSAAFAFAGSDDLSGVEQFEYRLDGGDWIATTSTDADVSDVGPGAHTYAIRAVDRAGNASDVVEQSWTVDRATGVSVAAASGTYGDTTTLQASLTWHGDGSALAGKVIEFTIGGLEVGTAVTDDNGVALLGNVSLAGLDADTYGATLGARFAGDNDYAGSQGAGSLVIARATPTIAIDWSDWTYDGTAHAASGSVTGVVGGLQASLEGVELDFTYYKGVGTGNRLGSTAPSNAGTYWVEVAFPGSKNYNPASQTRAYVTVNKAVATIAVQGTTVTYDGHAHGATGGATGVNGQDLSGLDLGAIFTDVPGGTAHWTFTDTTGNYNDAAGSVTIAITQAEATFNIQGYSGVYDGAAHGVTGSAAGVNGEDLSGLLDLGASQAGAGTYATTWSFAGNTNYLPATDTATIVIQRATTTTSVTGGTFTYDQAGHGATDASVTGAGGLTATPTLVYTDAGGNVLAGFPTGAGSYTVCATYDGDANHTGGSATAAIAIQKANSIVTVVGGSFTYDGQAHPATGSVKGVNGTSLGTPTFTYSYTDEYGNVVTTTSAPVEPGYYTVTATFAGDSNYNPASATATIMIAFEVRTLTDLSKAFNSGRTIPIKLQLTNASGNNVSSASTDVTAIRLERVNADGSTTQVALQDAGNANPGNLFRYDAALGGYIFNLSTKGLGAGTYNFYWTAEGDPAEHKLTFKLV